MTSWDPAALELISLMARSVRGPRREGLFALWLTLRVAQDLQLDPPLGERALRRRLAALVQLQDAPPETVPGILNGLVAPARDGAGVEAADAVRKAERAARHALHPSGR